MRRREFIAGLAGSAALPLVAGAQPKNRPVVGVIRTTTPDDAPTLLVPFNQGLKEAGFAVGLNVDVDFRAEQRYERLASVVTELLNKPVDVIVATGAINAALVAKAATQTVPIVFVIGSDPVETGLVKSLSHPGGNITGVTLFSSAHNAKRSELLREIVPGANAFGLLINPDNPNSNREVKVLEQVALSGGWALHVAQASKDSDLNDAVASLAKSGVGGFTHSVDVYLQTKHRELIDLSIKRRLPIVLSRREAAVDGALVSFGSRPRDTYMAAGVQVGRILKGTAPADLPVQLPTIFETIVNLKTAKAIGTAIPTSILLRADEVIE